MAERELQYYVQRPDGTEEGPFGRRDVVARFEDETFSYHCQVRNSLVKRWNEPDSFTFLTEIVAQYRERDKDSFESRPVEKLKRRIAAKKPDIQPKGSVQQRSTFSFSSAPASLRIMAGLMDGGILLGLGLVVLVMTKAIVDSGLVDRSIGLHLAIVMLYAAALIYIAWTIGFRAQTFGQQFWGIMVVGMKGQPVYLAKAFVFAFGSVVFGLLTPVLCYVFPSRRAIPERISRTRVVRIRVLANDHEVVPL